MRSAPSGWPRARSSRCCAWPGTPYAGAIRTWLPEAEVAFDPFHVVALAGAAVDEIRMQECKTKGPSTTPGGMWIKHARWALLKAPEKLADRQRLALLGIQQSQRLYRAYLLKEQLRAPLPTAKAPAHLAPGSPGQCAPSSNRSSDSPAPCAATATESSPRSSSA